MTRNAVLVLAARVAAPLPGAVRVAIRTDDRADARQRAAPARRRRPRSRWCRPLDAQVVLLDLGTERERALAAARRAAHASAAPVVVVVPDGSFVTAALAAGARGVVHRDSIGPEWSAALTAVEAG
jgi:DNA-binding NarL/FixJ family response regulator